MRSIATYAPVLLAAQSFFTTVVESASPRRLVNEFLEDGTPVWRYVDLPPLEQVLGAELSNHDKADGDGENDDYDASLHHRRMQEENSLRVLQNGCPGQDSAYSYSFNQEIIIYLYGAERRMGPAEVRTFEQIVRQTWNDPSNNCFPSCFVIDQVKVVQQDYENNYRHSHPATTRALGGDDVAADDFGRTLEAALSDGDEYGDAVDLDDWHEDEDWDEDEDQDEDAAANFGHERRLHRRKRNRVRAAVRGRCRSVCRNPIKSRDRRLLEVQEEERLLEVKADGEIADYYDAVSAEDPHHPHRRLYACEEILRQKFDDAALGYRGPGTSALYCIGNIRIESRSDPRPPTSSPTCHTHRSSPSFSRSWESRSRPYKPPGKGGGGKGGGGKGGGGYRYSRSNRGGKGGGKGGCKRGCGGGYRRYGYGSKGSKGGYGYRRYGYGSKGSKGGYGKSF